MPRQWLQRLWQLAPPCVGALLGRSDKLEFRVEAGSGLVSAGYEFTYGLRGSWWHVMSTQVEVQSVSDIDGTDRILN